MKDSKTISDSVMTGNHIDALPDSYDSSAITNNYLKMKEMEYAWMKYERGFLGKVWGSKEHLANNVAGLIIIFVLFIGICYTAVNVSKEDFMENFKEFWKTMSAILTLAVGFVFGIKYAKK